MRKVNEVLQIYLHQKMKISLIIIHLTMYGEPFKEVIPKIAKDNL